MLGVFFSWVGPRPHLVVHNRCVRNITFLGGVVKYNKETVTPEQMASQETYFWIVQLVQGSNGGGFIRETELVTKKYERVEALIEKWEDLINSGEYYVSVVAVAEKEYETYSL